MVNDRITFRRFVFLKLHLLTWLAIVIGIVGVLLLQQPRHKTTYGGGLMSLFGEISVFEYGWPLEVAMRSETNRSNVGPDFQWWPLGIFFNSLVGAVFVFAIAFSTERWLRSQAKWQFSVVSMICFFFVVSATLATTQYAGQIFDVSISELPIYAQFIAVMGFAFVFHTTASTVVAVIKSNRRDSMPKK